MFYFWLSKQHVAPAQEQVKSIFNVYLPKDAMNMCKYSIDLFFNGNFTTKDNIYLITQNNW